MTSTNSPLTLEVCPSRDKISASLNSQLIYVLLEIDPRQNEGEQRTPLNLSLVVDRSTSMQGERLNRIKAAAGLLLEKLSSSDVISIVTFSDRAELVVPARRVGNKVTLMSPINSIIASGATEIYQGLEAGFKELRKFATEDHISHLILMTDGHTYGDADACLALAKKAADHGVGFSGFGIGEEWNDQFLDHLVEPSGGLSAFVETPQQLVNCLQSRVTGLGSIYAQNLRLELAASHGTTLQSSFKITPYAQPAPHRDNEIKLGAIEGDEPLSCLLELKIPSLPAGAELMIKFTLTLDIPTAGLTNYEVVTGIGLPVAENPDVFKPDKRLIDAVQILNFYRMNEQSWQDVENGNLLQATQRMERLETRLLQAGYVELAEQAKLEAARIKQAGTISLAGRKRLKYGTRALMTGAVRKKTQPVAEVAPP